MARGRRAPYSVGVRTALDLYLKQNQQFFDRFARNV